MQREDHEDAPGSERDPAEELAGALAQRRYRAEREQSAGDRGEERPELFEPDHCVRREAERKEMHVRASSRDVEPDASIPAPAARRRISSASVAVVEVDVAASCTCRPGAVAKLLDAPLAAVGLRSTALRDRRGLACRTDSTCSSGVATSFEWGRVGVSGVALLMHRLLATPRALWFRGRAPGEQAGHARALKNQVAAAENGEGGRDASLARRRLGLIRA